MYRAEVEKPCFRPTSSVSWIIASSPTGLPLPVSALPQPMVYRGFGPIVEPQDTDDPKVLLLPMLEGKTKDLQSSYSLIATINTGLFSFSIYYLCAQRFFFIFNVFNQIEIIFNLPFYDLF